MCSDYDLIIDKPLQVPVETTFNYNTTIHLLYKDLTIKHHQFFFLLSSLFLIIVFGCAAI